MHDRFIPTRAGNTPADRLEITYYGFYGPVATKLVNAPSIAERRTVEGGSGRYEVVDYDQSLDGLAVTIAKAKGDLRRNGTLDPMMDFETDEIGLAVAATTFSIVVSGASCAMRVPSSRPSKGRVTIERPPGRPPGASAW